MSKKKDLVIVSLATFCLTASLFMTGLIRSAGVGEYNIWADINNDGTVDIFDAILLANAFNTKGQNLTKAIVSYDSGWVNITDRQGQEIIIQHGLNIIDWNSHDLMVDIVGKTADYGSDLLRRMGLRKLPGVYESFNRTYGGTAPDWANALVQTSDGGFAMAGTTYSFGAGTYDFWLVKVDAGGNEEWNMTYGGPIDDVATALVQTSDGGYAIAGDTYSFGEGFYDFWLVKTDADGNALWNRTYGAPGWDQAYGLVQTDDGGYAIAGFTESSGTTDFWLVKTDVDGDALWNKTYGGTKDDDAYSVVQTSDGGYALAGHTYSYGAGKDDFWLVKTDADGNALWNRTYGGTDFEWANALIQTTDGGYALAGYSGAGGGFYLVKTDAYGNFTWEMSYGGIGWDEAFELVQTSDGGYALAGYTLSYGAGNSDFWLVKTDANGNHEWNVTYGGTGDDRAYGLVQTSDGGYTLAGYTSSYGAGSQDFWLVRTNLEFDIVNSFSWIDSTANTIVLYRGSADPDWNYVRVRILKTK